MFELTINSEVFTAGIKQDLIPKLPEQSMVVMDNAAFHKQAEMQEALGAAGHTLLYLLPYFPDLNPIEKKWAQIKSLRRKVGGSIDALFMNSFNLSVIDYICFSPN